MKTLLLLLVPILSFAQYQTPDSLFLVDGRTTACLITGIDDSRIYFNYSNNAKETVIIKALSRAYMDSFGNIYDAGKGFHFDEDVLNDYANKRLERLKEQREINAELKRISLSKMKETSEDSVITPEIINLNPPAKETETYKKWSFGILYVPYSSGSIYNVARNGSNPSDANIYFYTENDINMEAQLMYGVTKNLRVTLDAGYKSSYNESGYEYHYTNVTYNDNQGSEKTVGLKIFDFSLGLKYYFKDLLTDKVNFFATIGFGKQIAFSKNTYNYLFIEPQPLVINEDNLEEYGEELNSPWHFNIGFGVEYYFNESLSLTSNIRVLYSSATGNYKARYVNNTQIISRSESYTQRDFITKIGLGLNFYF